MIFHGVDVSGVAFEQLGEAVVFAVERLDFCGALFFETIAVGGVGPHDGLVSGDCVIPDTVEEGHEAVVVLLGEWILFVIVATGTSEAHPEEGFSGDLHDVGEHIVFCERGVCGTDVALHDAKEPRGGDGLTRWGDQLVACNLFRDEARVGDVVVEGVDEVIAEAPNVVFVSVVLESFCFCVANNVHPVARPFLAVVGTCEEAFDEAWPRVGCLVGDECVDLFGGWRQTEEVVGGASDELCLLGSGGGLESGLFEACVEETVDGVGCGSVGGRGIRDGAIGPPVGG